MLDATEDKFGNANANQDYNQASMQSSTASTYSEKYQTYFNKKQYGDLTKKVVAKATESQDMKVHMHHLSLHGNLHDVVGILFKIQKKKKKKIPSQDIYLSNINIQFILT